MKTQNLIEEPGRQLPVAGEFDVIVVGGGIAGTAAAVAAARGNARVCMLERYCALGGLATMGNVTVWLPLCDGRGNQVVAGLGEELLRLSVADLPAADAAAGLMPIPPAWLHDGSPEDRAAYRYQASFNPSAYMLALEKLVAASGVSLLYDTRFCAVLRQNDRISHVIVENKSGRSALAANVFIDATGDADVCFAAGEHTVSLDSNTLAGWFYTISGGRLAIHQCTRNYSPQADREGAEGPFFRGDDAAEVTAHITRTREMIRKRVEQLRKRDKDGDVQLLMPPAMACLRMTRRLDSGTSPSKETAQGWWDDIIGMSGDWRRRGPVYALPLRCLRGRRNKNLLAAGRCVSVDNSLWDALRVIPPCVVTGQAAGSAAAIAAQNSQGDLSRLDVKTLQAELRRQGVLLDRKRPERIITENG